MHRSLSFYRANRLLRPLRRRWLFLDTSPRAICKRLGRPFTVSMRNSNPTSRGNKRFLGCDRSFSFLRACFFFWSSRVYLTQSFLERMFLCRRHLYRSSKEIKTHLIVLIMFSYYFPLLISLSLSLSEQRARFDTRCTTVQSKTSSIDQLFAIVGTISYAYTSNTRANDDDPDRSNFHQ